MKSGAIYLLHGKGGSPNGSVYQLEQELRPRLPAREFVRILLPHSDPNVLAEESVTFLHNANLSAGALVVGISLGGLVAARLQEDGREDLHVACISSPTWADGVKLERKPAHRVALFSSTDEVIANRIADWPQLAETYELPWLSHDTDRHKVRLARLIEVYASGQKLQTAIIDHL